MPDSYLQTVKEVYRDAAISPDTGLCCTTSPVWQLPGLSVPPAMLEMNYGCGTTVHPRDLVNSPTVLYVGVGGGLELLQFAYFSRREGSVLGIDPVAEMRAACAANLEQAARDNPWFQPDFIALREGDALALPVEDASVDVAAQNCLFNIFEPADLRQALAEMYRVLRPHGRLVLSDPVCAQPIPDALRQDPRLRALCLSGAIPLADYLELLTDTGFGTVEVRARRPYRILDPAHYAVEHNIEVQSVEVCAIKDPMPEDGPCIFTGRAAIYTGRKELFDDGNGHVLGYNQPLAVCDKTAAALASLGREDLHLSPPTWFYDGGGCC
ncbi:MAG: arsenosugar biosynthesis arsenite methyltransferase ArsM [Gammaproteobacteria bacterium]|nr:arsenosugar biosynthesis arsenite methyltransferase ArsM [Gammaproteobacteria bacterium]